MKSDIKPTLLDRAIAYISPVWGAKREYSREVIASYRGQSIGRNGSWGGSMSSTGVRLPTTQNQKTARDRARNLDRNSVLASSLLDRAAENVVGLHIGIEPTTDDKDFNEQAEQEWTRFKAECDVSKRFHFDELTRLVLRSKWRDGDVGIVMVDAFGFPKLQVIEGDYIESPPAKYTGGMTVDGIELDEAGAAKRYWVRSIDEKYKTTYTPIDSRDFIFLANIQRTSEVRGMTKFQQAFEWFNHIEGYAEGTVIAARSATLYSLLIKKNNPTAGFSGFGTRTNQAGVDQRYQSIEGGTIKYLNPDEDVVQVDPKHPTQSFPDGIAAFCRFIGLQFGLPLEQVLLDFTRANYTVSRAIKIQVQRTAEIEQQNVASQFVSRVYRWVISKAINEGRITGKVPQNYWKHEWIAHPLQMVDEQKELAAAREAILLGLDARTYRARSIGYKFSDLVKQNEADRELMEEAGLPLVEDKDAIPTGPAGAGFNDTPNNTDTNNG